MLIDLHAHAPFPGYYSQRLHRGPFFVQGAEGDIRPRVGHWTLDAPNGVPKAGIA